MAVNPGNLINEKVSRLLSGKNGKPVLKPNKPMVLKDTVGNTKQKRERDTSCIPAFSLLMVCWKQNNFVDALCSNEISDFYACIKMRTMQRKSEKNNLYSGRLTPKQATTLLKRYPNLTKEI